MQETQVQSLGQEDPLEKGWQLIPVFLPGEFQGQRSLVGYSQWGPKEIDTTELLTLSKQIAQTLFVFLSLRFSSFYFCILVYFIYTYIFFHPVTLCWLVFS